MLFLKYKKFLQFQLHVLATEIMFAISKSFPTFHSREHRL